MKQNRGNIIIILLVSATFLATAFMVFGQGMGLYRKMKVRVDSKQMAGDVERSIIQMVGYRMQSVLELGPTSKTDFIAAFNQNNEIPGLGNFLIPSQASDYPTFTDFPDATAASQRCQNSSPLIPASNTTAEAFYFCLKFTPTTGSGSRRFQDDSSLQSFFESNSIAEVRVNLVDASKSNQGQNTLESVSAYKTGGDMGLTIFYGLYWQKKGDRLAQFKKFGDKFLSKGTFP